LLGQFEKIFRVLDSEATVKGSQYCCLIEANTHYVSVLQKNS